MHYIYAIREINTRGVYKVGRSKHPIVRRTELNTGNPRELEIAIILGQYETREEAVYYEGLAHDELSSRKVRNEWYSVTIAKLKEIQEYFERLQASEQVRMLALYQVDVNEDEE